MGSRLIAVSPAVLLFALLALASPPARAGDWYVTTGGTGAQTGANWDNALPTIALGLQKASAGDTVRVWAGLYPERITLKAGVTLSGGHFFIGQVPFLSVIDGGNGGTVVTVPSGATSTTVLEGFTIQNGSGTGIGGKAYGGGIYCAGASPVLRWNHVTGCHADNGGGIYLSSSNAEVTLSHFTGNRAGSGGAIACAGGAPVVSIGTFRRNAADDSGGAVFVAGAPDIVIGCNVFEANRAPTGSAVALNTGWFLSNTLIRNGGSAKGALAVNAGALVAVANTIVADNSSGVWLAPLAASLFYNNDVYGNGDANYSGVADPTGTNGNISAPPALADPAIGDYTPCFGSPCVDRGNDLVVPPGAVDYYARARISGVCVDIGAAELVQPAPLQPIHVKGDTGNDANDGLSWAKAKKTPYEGIQAAIASGREVWIAKGSYYHWFQILNHNVMMYGGFAGTETKRNERDPEKNETILSAYDTDRPVIRFINGIAEPGKQTIIDGFTIRDGLHKGNPPDHDAGGILCADTEVIISGNIIKDNLGTGVAVGGKVSPIISCNTVYRNGPIGGGWHRGGVIVGCPTGRILNNTIDFNGADLGAGGVNVSISPGAILPASGTFDICNNRIVRNQGLNGGGIHVSGGTAQVFPVIRGNVIEMNYATSVHPAAGGGVWGADYFEIVDNLIMNNSADIGGGISAGERYNTETKDSIIANNILVSNTYGSLFEVVKGGGGIGLTGGYVQITNNTFVNNEDAVSLMNYPHESPFYAGGVAIRNNIFTGGPRGIYRAPDVSTGPAMSNNAFFGNTQNYDGLPPGAADVFQDPHYVNAAGGDYHLRSDSPCIDKGLDAAVPAGALDCDAEPRILGAHVDIGADEYTEAYAVVVPDAGAALRIAGGLEAVTSATLAALNVEDTGTSQNKVDIRDAVRLMRKATGLE